MPRKQKKYHYIYRTTCDVNGRYYVGMHSTDDLNDGYLGSGKRLWNSIKKHGKDNHRLEILEFFDSRNELKNREEQLVNEDMLQDPMCMNLTTGGQGGFFSVEACRKGANVTNEKHQDLLFEWRSKGGKISQKLHGCPLDGNRFDWTNKTHSQTTKDKMSKADRTGTKNSQYNTCWITKNEKNKKIKKSDLNLYLNDGWIRGRKMK